MQDEVIDMMVGALLFNYQPSTSGFYDNACNLVDMPSFNRVGATFLDMPANKSMASGWFSHFASSSGARRNNVETSPLILSVVALPTAHDCAWQKGRPPLCAIGQVQPRWRSPLGGRL